VGAGILGRFGPAPERDRAGGKDREAAHLQVAQVGTVANPDVDAGGHADQGGDGDVDVRQVGCVEAIEEQRVSRGLAGHGARGREKEVTEERQRTPQIPPVEPERASDEAEHAPAESTRYILIPAPDP
jgi:hypothetical protein